MDEIITRDELKEILHLEKKKKIKKKPYRKKERSEYEIAVKILEKITDKYEFTW